MDNLIENNKFHRAFYPDDKRILFENGQFQNGRENKEYTLFINSVDRNLSRFPNPFQFNIDFMAQFSNPHSNNNDSFYQDQNNPLTTIRNINIPFKIDELNYIYFKQIYIPTVLLPSSSLQDKYFILRIKELNMQYQYSSSPYFNPSTDIYLYNIGNMNDSIVLDSKTIQIFKTDIKPVINRLSLQFFTSDFKPITVITNLDEPSNPGAWQIVLNIGDDTNPLSPLYSGNNLFMEIKLGVNDKQILTLK
jgi:hypothetical protein